MSQKHVESSSRNSIESCTLQLLSWRPFHRSKTLDSSEHSPQPQSQSPYISSTKRPCFSDRSTTSFSIEAMSRLSLADEDNKLSVSASNYNNNSKGGSFRLVARRKRRRRNSRSVSGRSSDRSGTLRCCSIGAHNGTCSDFPFAVGTDSSGELFSEANWASDVSEARRSRQERRDYGGEKEASGFGFADPMGNESGYGSEPGYRGDVEFDYGDSGYEILGWINDRLHLNPSRIEERDSSFS